MTWSVTSHDFAKKDLTLPVTLPEKALDAIDAETVLDPFMGS